MNKYNCEILEEDLSIPQWNGYYTAEEEASANATDAAFNEMLEESCQYFDSIEPPF